MLSEQELAQKIDTLKNTIWDPVAPEKITSSYDKTPYRMPKPEELKRRQELLCKILDETAKTATGRRMLEQLPDNTQIVYYDGGPNESTDVYSRGGFTCDHIPVLLFSRTDCPMCCLVDAVCHESSHIILYKKVGDLAKLPDCPIDEIAKPYGFYIARALDETTAFVNGWRGMFEYLGLKKELKVQDFIYAENIEYYLKFWFQRTLCLSQGNRFKIENAADVFKCSDESIAGPKIKRMFLENEPLLKNPELMRFLHHTYKIFADSVIKKAAKLSSKEKDGAEWVKNFSRLVEPAVAKGTHVCINKHKKWRKYCRKIVKRRWARTEQLIAQKTR